MLITSAEIPSAVSEFYNRQLLERALPDLVFELFGQVRPLPQRNSKVIKFRRYESLPTTVTPLVAGVPPSSTDPTKTDITATVKQYGAYIEYTDEVELTNPDPILSEFTDLLGEQSAQSLDLLRRNTLTAGTNVLYTNGSSRSDVTSTLDLATLRKARRTLRNNNAAYIRDILAPSVKTATVPIPKSYICIIHPDVAHDVRQLTGFRGIEEYGQLQTIHESEIGAIPSIQMRFLETTQAKIVAGAGGSSSAVKNTNGLADVYLTLIIAKNAYGIVPLRGAALTTHLQGRGSGGTSDPLEQVGTIGWKAFTTQVILNDNFIIRIESAASK